jgi:hypothetical protein
MRNYRAYILGAEGHRFIWAEGFLRDHPDDEVALNAARKLADKYDVEVWEAGRLVARLSAVGELTSPGLAPSLVSPIPSDSEKSAVGPISLRKVSELASGSNLFLDKAGTSENSSEKLPHVS